MVCNPAEKMLVPEWPQVEQRGIAAKQMEIPPQDEQRLKCPRCDSCNTKFCYYNNYSLSQPRHFCKACKRYWTRGGTLRNVPFGGGCRKNKRLKQPVPVDSAASAPPARPNFCFPDFRSKAPSMENLSMPISSAGFDLPQLSSVWMHIESEFQPPTHSLLPDFPLLAPSPTSVLTSQRKQGMGLKEAPPCDDFQAFFPMLHWGSNGEPSFSEGVSMGEESGMIGKKITGWQFHSENSLENMGSESSLYWTSGASSMIPLI